MICSVRAKQISLLTPLPLSQSLQILEQAASLQRTCVNGQEVLTLILCHLLADLNSFGTVDAPVAPSMGDTGDRNRLLKQSARMVTNAIMPNGKDGFDTTSAVKQWRCLRHLTAITDAVVTKSGYVLSRAMYWPLLILPNLT